MAAMEVVEETSSLAAQAALLRVIISLAALADFSLVRDMGPALVGVEPYKSTGVPS